MTTLVMAVACWIVLTLWGWLELRFSGLVPLSTGLTVGVVYVVAMASGTRGWPLFGCFSSSTPASTCSTFRSRTWYS